jgi:hypothetical protein
MSALGQQRTFRSVIGMPESGHEGYYFLAVDQPVCSSIATVLPTYETGSRQSTVRYTELAPNRFKNLWR